MLTDIQIVAQAGVNGAAGVIGGTSARPIFIGLITGIAFGALLQRAGASDYNLLAGMLRLKDLTIMKFLFLAIAVGSVGMYTVDALGTAHIGIAPLYLLGITVGGLVFGLGWGLSGYCPGTSLVAMAEGKADAVFTVLGGLLGALTLALTWDSLKPVLVDPFNYGSQGLPELIGVKPLLVASVFAAAIIVFIMFLDRIGKPGAAAEPRRSAAVDS